MREIPATLDLNPIGGHPKASVIWMHGLGADSNDFVPVVEHFGVLAEHVRFVFPNAPMRSVTVNGGALMPAWYDILSADLVSIEDKPGILAAIEDINALIERECALGIPAHQIVLAGFSQGAAMALQVGLRYPQTLGGVVALSGYLPLPEDLRHKCHEANAKIPIFMAHGLFDTLVPMDLAERCRSFLESLRYSVDWHTYPMAHSVDMTELKDIKQFLNTVLFA